VSAEKLGAEGVCHDDSTVHSEDVVLVLKTENGGEIVVFVPNSS